MHNPNYPWSAVHVSAILETDNTKLIGRIAEGRQALENRRAIPARIDEAEHLAIKAAWKALAALKAQRLDKSVGAE
jgi:hypothetical protein